MFHTKLEIETRPKQGDVLQPGGARMGENTVSVVIIIAPANQSPEQTHPRLEGGFHREE